MFQMPIVIALGLSLLAVPLTPAAVAAQGVAPL